MMNYFESDRLAIDRLKEEYNLHKNLVIGFDFDNTIYDYHSVGLRISPVVQLLKQCTNLNFAMCLYTIMSDKDGDMCMLDKLEYCKGLGIKVDFVNSSPIMKGSVKPFFSILLDDRAGLASAYNTLRIALMELDLIIR